MAKKTAISTVRKFLIVDIVPGPILFKKRNYDLAALSPEEAAYLIENECPYIKWEEQEQEAKTPEE